MGDMGKGTHNFSNTEIHILECGLRWIKECEDTFADRLFHRLLRDHPEFTSSLHATGLQSFNRHIVQVIHTIIDELRSCGKILSPIRELWADLSPATVSPFGPEQFVKIAETYLDILSELAEDAWSPAMESAWRKAIHEVSIDLWGHQPESLPLSKMLSPFQFIKRRKHSMSHPLVFFLGTFMILAGGIASIGLWSRCRMAEVKLQRKPLLKKVWCS
jgi:hemoglobin-like flavoprotein